MVALSKLAFIGLLLSTSVYAAPASAELEARGDSSATLIGWCEQDRGPLGVTNGQMWCEIQQDGQTKLKISEYYKFNSDWNEERCTSNNNLSVCVKMMQCTIKDSNGNTFFTQGCGGNMPCRRKPGTIGKGNKPIYICHEDFKRGIRI